MGGADRNRRLGAWGENQACRWLQRRGFVVVARNYHTPAGEVDIVARCGDDWYFIEVKTRTQQSLATDLAITRQKRRRFYKAMNRFCYQRGIVPAGSLIAAGLIVAVDVARQMAHFRLATFTPWD